MQSEIAAISKPGGIVIHPPAVLLRSRGGREHSSELTVLYVIIQILKMKIQVRATLILLFLMTMVFTADAQFDLSGQYVSRGEYRHGYGRLISTDAKPAAFVSQRLRLQAMYRTYGVQLFASLQDIRTWGNTSQANSTDGGLLTLHEGWAEIPFADSSDWSVKIGRQELNYDNVRFLGNLDWALQARSHDFALVKYEEANTKLHIGAGYNQTGENISGNVYQIANQYKTAQMLRYQFKKQATELAFLFWNNGRETQRTDSTGKIIDQEMHYMQTIGFSTLSYSFPDNTVLSGFAYFQTGRDIAGKAVRAYDVSLQAQTTALGDSKSSMLKLTLGAELLSGTDFSVEKSFNHSFTPLYGTNHVHNGYMDYFYVGGRFENSLGLTDVFLRSRYDSPSKWFIAGDIHYFASAEPAHIGNEVLGKHLGIELDLTYGTVISTDVSLQIGYSQMFASETLKALQSATASSNQNWAYVMFIVRPKSSKKFIGVMP